MNKAIVVLGAILTFYALYNLMGIIAAVSGFICAIGIFIDAVKPYADIMGINIPAVPDISEIYMYAALSLLGSFLIGYGVGKK